jgi:hypothetical protein
MAQHELTHTTEQQARIAQLIQEHNQNSETLSKPRKPYDTQQLANLLHSMDIVESS